MKKVFSVLVLLCILPMLCSCGLFGNKSYDFSYISSDRYVSGNTTIDASEKFKTVHVDWYNGSVSIVSADVNTITIEETIKDNKEVDDDHKVHYMYNEDSISIKYGKSGVKDYDGIVKDLKVIVPQVDDYYIGVISYDADVYVDASAYENTIDKMSISSVSALVDVKISSADEVYISGQNIDIKDSNRQYFKIVSSGTINSLNINSTYANVIIEADEILKIGDTFGSLFNETHISANKMNNLSFDTAKGAAYVAVKEFKSIDITAKMKAVYIYVLSDCEFHLVVDRNIKVYPEDKEYISNKTEVNFENATKISDDEYKYGSGSKEIKVSTINEVYLVCISG